MRQMHRLGVAKALKLAAEAGIRNDYRSGQEILQTTIDKINRETPQDGYCQQYVLSPPFASLLSILTFPVQVGWRAEDCSIRDEKRH